MSQKLLKFSKGLYLRPLQFWIPSFSSINVSLHGKKRLGKKDRKGWHCDKILVHLKNLDLLSQFKCLNNLMYILNFWLQKLKKLKHAPFCDVGSTFIISCELGYHVFGLVGDKILYATHLYALKQNVGTMVRFVVIPSMSLPPSHSLDPLTPKVACKFGLNFNKPF